MHIAIISPHPASCETLPIKLVISEESASKLPESWRYGVAPDGVLALSLNIVSLGILILVFFADNLWGGEPKGTFIITTLLTCSTLASLWGSNIVQNRIIQRLRQRPDVLDVS